MHNAPNQKYGTYINTDSPSQDFIFHVGGNKLEQINNLKYLHDPLRETGSVG